jgi:hypothetical protein
MAIYKINGNLFTNQTSRFPIISNHGHAYVVVFYIYNANAICSVPIKNRSKEELLHAYCKIYAWLTLHGFKPLLHKLDNKHPKMSKLLSPPNKHASTTFHQISIAQTPPNGLYAPGKIIFLLAWQAFPNLFPFKKSSIDGKQYLDHLGEPRGLLSYI